MNTHPVFDAPDPFRIVALKGVKLKRGTLTLELPPKSVVRVSAWR